MSMATGFEARVPFCDYRLVEYVWNIPWHMKTVDGIEKGVLRRAFAEVLPEDVLYRKKSPYPGAQSPAYIEAIRARAREVVNDPNAAIAPYIDTQAARSLVENNTADIPGITLVPLYERIIHLNEWLEKYEVTLYL
jgi:asparagine synthase (glutamine-hydrolysing)